QPWAPSRLAVLPPAVAAARSGSTGRQSDGHYRPSDTDQTSIKDGDRGMAVQRLRGRLSRDWLVPRKTVIAFALGLAALGGAVELALDPPRSIMGVDIADQVNSDPAAYEVSVGATALEIVRVEEDDPRWDCRTMGNRICGKA